MGNVKTVTEEIKDFGDGLSSSLLGALAKGLVAKGRICPMAKGHIRELKAGSRNSLRSDGDRKNERPER